MENNIISRKLDFDTLLVKYPQLAPYFKGGKYDFRNNDAVIAITEVLLKEWGLKVHIHSDRLCPRIFNRLDYLEFMRRLLGSWTKHVGLDVGTGHLAIYALLGAKLFDLQFVGTDIDQESLELARDIVEQNHLQEKIQLVLTRPQEPLFSRFVELLGSRNGFVVCNPPFYSSFDEMERRAEIKSGPRFPTAAANELVVEGGEVAFVHRMILESETVKASSIRWFSSLIGKYDSLKPLISLLRARKIDNFGVHEFRSSQALAGTRRWILFWSFQPERPDADLFNSIVHQKTRRELQCTPEKLLERIDGLENVDKTRNSGSVVLELPGDVWSRAYRRQKRFLQDRAQVEVLLGNPIKLIWKSGHNYQLFESFYNWCKRIEQS
ncbi:uncharacterized protein OGAPODRAFT_17476 [Ogataea polymorpha]|uniref:Uncharacterized protein n=1 Tax=Ogataea polymorpha TaxID=460523 RepID=A0A1B7SBI3_9ASCO|nr:uncharacterized protein OGAPODRAFT_17476 [Ogataea polymorpha]KAH3659507.1 hypothetical protein OGATHE_005552 [Ogataea polymorpha]OBA13823.1 hypothetical protein OGAPODRAFT_17476 [Ogataea polymorpha]